MQTMQIVTCLQCLSLSRYLLYLQFKAFPKRSDISTRKSQKCAFSCTAAILLHINVLFLGHVHFPFFGFCIGPSTSLVRSIGRSFMKIDGLGCRMYIFLYTYWSEKPSPHLFSPFWILSRGKFLVNLLVICRHATHEICGEPTIQCSSGQPQCSAHGQRLREHCPRFPCRSILQCWMIAV